MNSKIPSLRTFTELFSHAIALPKASPSLCASSVVLHNFSSLSNTSSTQTFQQSRPRGIWWTVALGSVEAIVPSATTSSSSKLYQCKSWHLLFLSLLLWPHLAFSRLLRSPTWRLPCCDYQKTQWKRTIIVKHIRYCTYYYIMQ